MTAVVPASLFITVIEGMDLLKAIGVRTSAHAVLALSPQSGAGR